MSNNGRPNEDPGFFWYIILLVVGVVCWKLPVFVFNLGKDKSSSIKNYDLKVAEAIVVSFSIPICVLIFGGIKFLKLRRIENLSDAVAHANPWVLLLLFVDVLLVIYYVGLLFFGEREKGEDRRVNEEFGCGNNLINDSRMFGEDSIDRSVVFGHQLILGASGSGKTYSVLERQIFNSIKRGEVIFIIDPKGDLEFRDSVYTFCGINGREEDFKYFSISHPEMSHHMNPFGDCKVNEIKDMIISATDWSEPHYKKMAEVSIMKALLSREIDTHVTISEILELLPKDRELTGLYADLELMKISEFGPIIDDAKAPSMFDMYSSNKVVFISLDVQAYPQASVQLGRIILSSIMALSNRVQTVLRTEDRVKTSIFIDEFGSFLTENFVNFINKARSSNFRAVLATQSVGDLEVYSPEMRKQLLDSITTKVVMRMSDPDSIEYCARLFGTQKGIEETRQFSEDNFWMNKEDTGLGTSKEVEKFIVHPSDIRSLSVGDGYVLTQNPYAVFETRFWPIRRRIEEIVRYEKEETEEKVDESNEWEEHSMAHVQAASEERSAIDRI
jgi:type IV secretory pathway TraG/TraD family ATPase VirD4